MRFRQLSARGSDRATAYNTSGKLVRRGDQLYVTWLESPPAPGAMARIVLAVCNAANGTLQRALILGEGIDNHCGAALALDRAGRLHTVIGAHHGSFLYRTSERPDDLAHWSAPEALGPADTYPSLAIDASGTLHLAHRERGARWQLWYRRKRPGQPWEAPRALAISPEPGYNHFMQSLSVGPTGTLHLTFQYHYAASGRAEDCTGRAAVYLYSEDGGESWINEGCRCTSLPLAIEDARAIWRSPEGGLRIGNHVVDGRGGAWLFAVTPDYQRGVLWRREAGEWIALDLGDVWPELDLAGGCSSSLTRDAGGRIWLAVAAAPGGVATPWFDPSHEIFVLSLDEEGRPLGYRQVTRTDPTVAHWLPALEPWDWARQRGGALPDETPWMLYTAGLNAGGIGGDNRNTVQTRVYLGKV
ncbi:MAG: BNR-4 repeat-containing protein [Anaerolineae bacterium]